MPKRTEDEMITLAEAATESGIPIRTLRSAVLAKRMWAEKRGRDWWTVRSELTRFQKTYTPHKPAKKV